jgi:hypothetical protein
MNRPSKKPVLIDRDKPLETKPPPRWLRHFTPWRVFFLACLLLFVFFRFVWPSVTYSFPLKEAEAASIAALRATTDPSGLFPRAWPVQTTMRDYDKRWVVVVQSADPAAGPAVARGGNYMVVLVDPANAKTFVLEQGKGPPPPDAGMTVPGAPLLPRDEIMLRVIEYGRAEPSKNFANPEITAMERSGDAWILTLETPPGRGNLYRIVRVHAQTGTVTILREGRK